MVNVFFCDVKKFVLDALELNVCASRKEYLDSITDLKRQNQSLLVWRLLEYVLKKYYDFLLVDATVNNDGKWSVKDFIGDFSLAHSDNIVAVAIAPNSVGVDVEKVTKKILKLSKKYGSENEKELTRIWTERESKIKANSSHLIVKNYDVKDENGYDYVLSVACKNDEICLNKIDLKEII